MAQVEKNGPNPAGKHRKSKNIEAVLQRTDQVTRWTQFSSKMTGTLENGNQKHWLVFFVDSQIFLDRFQPELICFQEIFAEQFTEYCVRNHRPKYFSGMLSPSFNFSLIKIILNHRSTKNLVYPVLLFYKRYISLYSLYSLYFLYSLYSEGEGVRVIINVFQKTWAKGL